MRHITDFYRKMSRCLDRQSLLRFMVSASCVLIIIMGNLHLPEALAQNSKEPTFPGLQINGSIHNNPFYDYWEQYGKYLMEQHPEMKTKTEIEKARFIFGIVGDKAAAVGMIPNYSQDTREYMKVKLGEEFQDRGSCGDMNEILKAAFRGAGFQNSKSFICDKKKWWNMNARWDPNADHGAQGVPDDKGNYLMFDLWEHGRATGSFKGGAGSRWKGIELKIWANELAKDGYKDFKTKGVTGYHVEIATPGDIAEKAQKAWQKEQTRRSKRQRRGLPPETAGLGPPLLLKNLKVIPPKNVEPGDIAEFKAIAYYQQKKSKQLIKAEVTDVDSCKWSFSLGEPLPKEKGKVKVTCDMGDKDLKAVAEFTGRGGYTKKNIICKASASKRVKMLPLAFLKIKADPKEAKTGETVKLTVIATYKNSKCVVEKRNPDPPATRWTASEGGDILHEGLQMRIKPDMWKGAVTVRAALKCPVTNKEIPSDPISVRVMQLERVAVKAPKSIDVCKSVEFKALGYYPDEPDKPVDLTDRASWDFSGRYTVLAKNKVRADWPESTIKVQAKIKNPPDLLPGKAEVKVNPLPETSPWFPLQDVSIATEVKVGQTVQNRAIEFRCGNDGPAPVTATNVTWVSEKPELLSCTSHGACTGLRSGIARIILVYQGRDVTSRYVTVSEDESKTRPSEGFAEVHSKDGVIKGTDYGGVEDDKPVKPEPTSPLEAGVVPEGDARGTRPTDRASGGFTEHGQESVGLPGIQLKPAVDTSGDTGHGFSERGQEKPWPSSGADVEFGETRKPDEGLMGVTVDDKDQDMATPPSDADDQNWFDEYQDELHEHRAGKHRARDIDRTLQDMRRRQQQVANDPEWQMLMEQSQQNLRDAGQGLSDSLGPGSSGSSSSDPSYGRTRQQTLPYMEKDPYKNRGYRKYQREADKKKQQPSSKGTGSTDRIMDVDPGDTTVPGEDNINDYWPSR